MKRVLVILQQHPTDRMLDVVVCRNCGQAVLYGNLINNTGHSACPHCYEGMRHHINHTRDTDYDKYRDSPHLYQMDEDKYQAAVTKLQTKYRKE